MDILKKIGAGAVLVFAIVGIYFGAYLPLRKAQAYIVASRSFQSEPTLQNFEKSFTAALDTYSPVGQEETIRFLGGSIAPLLNPKVPEEGVRELARYFNWVIATYQPPQTALNYSQLILTAGGMQQTLWDLYKDKQAFELAEKLFTEGLVGSPNRPQFLISLRNLYRSAKDTPKDKELTAIIKQLWPAQD